MTDRTTDPADAHVAPGDHGTTTDTPRAEDLDEGGPRATDPAVTDAAAPGTTDPADDVTATESTEIERTGDAATTEPTGVAPDTVADDTAMAPDTVVDDTAVAPDTVVDLTEDPMAPDTAPDADDHVTHTGDAPVDDRVTHTGDGPVDEAFLAGVDLSSLRQRWHDTQVGFVDDPRAAVLGADALVEDAVTALVEQVAAERSRLAVPAGHGTGASTDDMRTAFQSYRDLFDRLLTR